MRERLFNLSPVFLWMIFPCLLSVTANELIILGTVNYTGF